MSKNVKRIVIVGGGTSGWMVAAALACRYAAQDLTIQLVESDTIGTVGVGEATVPGIIRFHQHLGIKESEFIKATNATFKLGIEFKDWRAQGTQFFHPFSDYGVPIAEQDFYLCWLRLKQEGYPHSLEEFALSIALANNNKFVQPDDNATSGLAMFGYAYHFDASLYAKFLRQYAEQKGVERIEGLITDSTVSDNGEIAHVILESGQRVEGDLFFDCSGFRALLIGEVLNSAYEDWTHWLPCDRAIAVQTTNPHAPAPYTRSTALSAGWQWRIPLRERVGNGYVYCSQYASDEEAKATLLANVEGELLTEPRAIRFKAGVRKNFWVKNCVAIGLASGFIEPLESTSISLIQTGVEKVMEAMPELSYDDACVKRTNELNTREYERIRDFIILHYKATSRTDSPFWEQVRNMDIPASLQEKIQAYTQDATLLDFGQESFKAASWQTMYSGFHLFPKRLPEPVLELNAEQLRVVAEKMRLAIAAGIQHAPSHNDFLAALYKE